MSYSEFIDPYNYQLPRHKFIECVAISWTIIVGLIVYSSIVGDMKLLWWQYSLMFMVTGMLHTETIRGSIRIIISFKGFSDFIISGISTKNFTRKMVKYKYDMNLDKMIFTIAVQRKVLVDMREAYKEYEKDLDNMSIDTVQKLDIIKVLQDRMDNILENHLRSTENKTVDRLIYENAILHTCVSNIDRKLSKVDYDFEDADEYIEKTIRTIFEGIRTDIKKALQKNKRGKDEIQS